MGKAVMLSIHPKWVERILSGEKTIEVRKTAPKIQTPFKCYIYCTKDGKYFYHGGIGEKQCLFKNPRTGEIRFDYAFELECCEIGEYDENNFLSGKVVGEFLCDKIYTVEDRGNRFVAGDDVCLTNIIAKASCLDFDDMKKYADGRKVLYAWHISDLKIYNEPKEITDFKRENRTEENVPCAHTKWLFEPCETCKACNLKRPPQSWCYVEEQ